MIPPIKKYAMDESLSWEERYRQLEAHHTKETTWFSGEIDRRDKEMADLAETIMNRPQMWALTKEGFLAALSIILDLMGKSGRELYSVCRVGSAIVGAEEPISDDFVFKVRALFAVLKDRKCDTAGPSLG